MSFPPVLILGAKGYVGSALSVHLLAVGFDVRSVDAGFRSASGTDPSQTRHYQDLTADELAAFGAVILLAGHSRVSTCADAPVEAFTNNVAGFVDLVHKLHGQKLIFASSVSVYVRTNGRQADEDDPLPEPATLYDLHKQTIERYSRLAYPNHYGLRLGSVCGPAPNMSPELLLNSLVGSAIRKGQVEVANPQACRPLLGINDLCRTVEAILTRPVPPGLYNIASVNVRIGELAEWVARRFGVPLVEIVSPTFYDTQVRTDRFRQAAEFEFRDTVESVTIALAAHYAAAAAGG